METTTRMKGILIASSISVLVVFAINLPGGLVQACSYAGTYAVCLFLLLIFAADIID